MNGVEFNFWPILFLFAVLGFLLGAAIFGLMAVFSLVM